MIHGYDTYEAVIDCLCNLLPEARNAEKDESYRTQPERDALSVLHQIFPLNPAKALEAGIIHKWLAQYPFGGEHASKPKRKDVLSRILDEAYYEDNDFGSTMRKLLRELFEMTTLSKEWEACGLLDADDAGNAHNRVNHGWEQGQLVPRDNVAMPTSSPAGVGRTRSGFPVGMNNRRREESPEEQALRRRRREAMVLGETGRPIQRGDIIERDPVFRDEDVEEELEQRLEAVTEAESTRDRNWWGWLSRLRPDGLAPQPSWPIH